ncbi:hypothetical protein PGT21_029587 [Puccinia graminis f. sp. tritici]|uniref:Uncharacterized protein n=1 Tax=Puccinia graminis f. sp. tritici TaxID=56615 RepID=A0A5B0LR97_PUCGR|nr:hypothetical protein PGT21_029587 [Puccinia graminis f. sp. tritici]KAA1082009.1 hypothetical protein PGTUg99_032526 [Puccinia graminis f. sp. tritici]
MRLSFQGTLNPRRQKTTLGHARTQVLGTIFLATTLVFLANLTICQRSGGQFFTPGLLIVNGPAPDSKKPAGKKILISLEITGDGVLKPSNTDAGSQLATAILSVEIYLANRERNITISQGPELMQGERGSSVKHMDFVIPECTPPGDYQVIFHELDRINGKQFYSIYSLPFHVLSTEAKGTENVGEGEQNKCDKFAASQAELQDSRPSKQPFLKKGVTGFTLRKGKLPLPENEDIFVPEVEVTTLIVEGTSNPKPAPPAEATTPPAPDVTEKPTPPIEKPRAPFKKPTPPALNDNPTPSPNQPTDREKEASPTAIIDFANTTVEDTPDAEKKASQNTGEPSNLKPTTIANGRDQVTSNPNVSPSSDNPVDSPDRSRPGEPQESLNLEKKKTKLSVGSSLNTEQSKTPPAASDSGNLARVANQSPILVADLKSPFNKRPTKVEGQEEIGGPLAGGGRLKTGSVNQGSGFTHAKDTSDRLGHDSLDSDSEYGTIHQNATIVEAVVNHGMLGTVSQNKTAVLGQSTKQMFFSVPLIAPSTSNCNVVSLGGWRILFFLPLTLHCIARLLNKL